MEKYIRTDNKFKSIEELGLTSNNLKTKNNNCKEIGIEVNEEDSFSQD